MKKVMISLACFILAMVIILAIRGNDMKQIKTEIEIAAPPAKVWSILADINKWQEWNPTINKSNGDTTVGSKLDITMCGKKEGEDGPRYNPVITKFEDSKLLQWSATMMAGFIMTNGKIIELTETETGTKLIHTETFSGMMMPMMWGHMETGVPPMLDKFNEALKKLAEE